MIRLISIHWIRYIVYNMQKLNVWGAPGAVGSTKQAVLVTPVRATPPSSPQISRRVGAANSILFIAKYSYYS